jgi:hypothetical protein
VKYRRAGAFGVVGADRHRAVAAVENDGTLLVRTRRGKTHRIRPDDPRARKANCLESILYRKRSPDLRKLEEGDVSDVDRPQI